MAQTEAVWASQLSYVKREPYETESVRRSTPPASPTRRSPAVAAYQAAATLRHMHNFGGASGSDTGHSGPPTGHLLPNEEVENFLTTLDRSSTGSASMFHHQNSMHAPAPPTYHHPSADSVGAQAAFVHSASPVYVPTTRAMLPASMPYIQGTHNPTRTTWPMQSDNSYTAASTHPSGVSPPFSFPPTPSPPMASPGSRTDASYNALRSSSLNPYSYMSSDLAYTHFTSQSMIGGQQRFATRPGMSPLTPDYSKYMPKLFLILYNILLEYSCVSPYVTYSLSQIKNKNFLF